MSKTYPFLALLCLLCNTLVGVAHAAIFSNFDQNDEGWRMACIVYQADGTIPEILTGPSVPGYAASGGNPGGHVTQRDPDARTWYWQAPAKFLGNKMAFKGGSLRFSLFQRDTEGNPFDDADVVIHDGQLVLTYFAAYPPSYEWTDYVVPMRNGSNWFVGDYTGGQHPTEQQFNQVISNLKGLYIRGEYIVGEDLGGLDAVSFSEKAALVNDFQESGEGWTVVSLKRGGPYDAMLNGPYTPDYYEVNGDPGGFLGFADRDANIWFWSAPVNRLGDLSSYEGGKLHFSLAQDTLINQFNDADIVLTGGGMTLVYDAPANPGKVWTRFSAPLAPVAWHKGSLSGPAPTLAEFRAVLKTVTALRIRGEFHSGSNTGLLDTVLLAAPNPAAAVAWRLYY